MIVWAAEHMSHLNEARRSEFRTRSLEARRGVNLCAGTPAAAATPSSPSSSRLNHGAGDICMITACPRRRMLVTRRAAARQIGARGDARDIRRCCDFREKEDERAHRGPQRSSSGSSSYFGLISLEFCGGNWTVISCSLVFGDFSSWCM